MKIVFMGTPRAAAISLERLLSDGNDIVAVYTQPDRPSGRGNKLHQSAVKEIASVADLPIYQPLKIKTEEALTIFRSHQADVVVVVAYGRILPPGFLHAFRYGALNVHFSLLPKYRGAAPVNWAIVNGEHETGVTVIQMNEGLDTGDILLQRSTLIGAQENAIELMERLSVLGAESISEAINNIDSLKPVTQNDGEASFAPIMNKGEGLINWNLNASDIERRIRGFQPFPSSYTFIGQSRLTIWRGEISPRDGPFAARPGTVIEADGDHFAVACGNSTVLTITEIQPEGKRRMSVRDFLNGAKISPGDMFSSTNRPISQQGEHN